MNFRFHTHDLKYRNDFKSLETLTERQGYFIWAKQMIQRGKFESAKDKLVWEDHAEGLSTREISPRVGLESSWIRRKIPKIRDYLKEQNYSKPSLRVVNFTQKIEFKVEENVPKTNPYEVLLLGSTSMRRRLLSLNL